MTWQPSNIKTELVQLSDKIASEFVSGERFDLTQRCTKVASELDMNERQATLLGEFVNAQVHMRLQPISPDASFTVCDPRKVAASRQKTASQNDLPPWLRAKKDGDKDRDDRDSNGRDKDDADDDDDSEDADEEEEGDDGADGDDGDAYDKNRPPFGSKKSASVLFGTQDDASHYLPIEPMNVVPRELVKLSSAPLFVDEAKVAAQQRQLDDERFLEQSERYKQACAERQTAEAAAMQLDETLGALVYMLERGDVTVPVLYKQACELLGTESGEALVYDVLVRAEVNIDALEPASVKLSSVALPHVANDYILAAAQLHEIAAAAITKSSALFESIQMTERDFRVAY